VLLAHSQFVSMPTLRQWAPGPEASARSSTTYRAPTLSCPHSFHPAKGITVQLVTEHDSSISVEALPRRLPEGDSPHIGKSGQRIRHELS